MSDGTRGAARTVKSGVLQQESPPPQTHGAGAARLRSLDGLRGIAAFVVVVHHLMLAVPVFAAVYLGPVLPEPGSAAWWVTRTPLRLFWAGKEAVLVFFVLSGYVLTLFAERRLGGAGQAVAYLRQRLVRLYVPVWGAVLLAVLIASVVPRDPAAASGWVALHRAPDATSAALDTVLVFGTGPAWLDSPLWSLSWEIWFSLLLPVLWYLVLKLPVRGHGGLWILLFAGVSAAAGHLTVPGILARPLQWLPVFAVGMMLAYDRDRVARLARAVSARGRLAWPAVLVVSALALASPAPGWGADGRLLGTLADGVAIVGVVGLLVAVTEWAPIQRLLERSPAQWLGRRSFSLYLVHEPVVVTFALLTGAAGWAWVAWSSVAVVVALVVAAAFFVVVERPALALSRRVGASWSRTRGRPADAG